MVVLLLLSDVLFSIHSFLNDFAIIRDRHFLVGMLKLFFHLLSDGILFFVLVWELINEVVKVFMVFLLVESLQVAQVSVLDFDVVGSVGGVVTVV